MNVVASTVDTALATERNGNGYHDFISRIRRRFALRQGPLFTTNVGDLWVTFLNNLPEEARQHYTCNACRHFVERFGGLVRIAEDGTKNPAIWPDDVPVFFTPAIKAIRKVIAKAKVNGVFVSSLTMYGQPVTGEWHHMAVDAPAEQVWKSLTLSASQRMAEKAEEFKMLIAGLLEFPLPVVEQALKLLRSDALYRSEKVIDPAEWLRELHVKRAATKNAEARDNLTWLAVATAPAGFCHVKGNMIGTLLEDIASGMDFDAVSKRFATKMHPLKYLRPQAAPTAGNIAQAEKLMGQLNAAGALDRRFARLDEIQTIWKPAPQRDEAPASNGVFAHLRPKDNKREVGEVNAPPQTMTWEKFSRTVLPGALAIEFYASGRGPYSAITTSTHHDAPPMLQWDNEEKRNPFSSYVYHGGSSPQQWNLEPGWCKVTGICLHPAMWQEGISNHSRSVLFVLAGAKDTRYKTSGNAIFPETLKSEFHAIRSTIEAYSKGAVIGGYDEASLACGIRGEGDNWGLLIRVTTDLGVMSYRLDRWD